MASSTKPFYVEPPNGGINTEASPILIDDRECVNNENFLVHEPGQMRLRNGYGSSFSTGGWLTAAYSVSVDAPFNVVHACGTSDDQWKSQVVAGTIGSVGSYYGTAGLGSITNFARRRYEHTSGDWSSNAATATSASLSAMGRGAVIYGCAYAAELGSGQTIQKWAGANEASASRNITIAAGARSGTFSVAPANGQTGMFIIDPTAYTVNGVGYSNMSYQIESHVGGSVNFTLTQPFGLGIPDWTGALAAGACNVQAVTSEYGSVSANPPLYPITTCIHQERLFYSQADSQVKWSAPTVPELHPSANKFTPESGNPVLAMHSTGRELIMLTRNSIWILIGDSESNYTLRKLYDNAGCYGQHAMTTWRGNLVFANDTGVWMLDQNLGLTEVTAPEDGRGIKADWMAWWQLDWNRTTGIHYMCESEDYILITKRRNASSTTTTHMWACYMPTMSWMKVNNSRATRAGIPDLFTELPAINRTYKAWGHFHGYRSFAAMDTLFRDEAVGNTYDVIVGLAGTTNLNIPGALEFKYFRPMGENTFRLLHTWTSHCVNYVNATSQAGNHVPFRLYLSTDPNLDVGSETTPGDILPRLETSATYAFDKYYTTEFDAYGGSGGLRGAVLRVRLATVVANDTYFPKSRKWFRLRFDLEQARDARVDEPVL